MKDRSRQRANRRKKLKEEEISFYNHEHYADPTAFYALKKMENEERAKAAHRTK